MKSVKVFALIKNVRIIRLTFTDAYDKVELQTNDRERFYMLNVNNDSIQTIIERTTQPQDNTKVFGYVRVSSDSQNVGRQLEKMEKLRISERDIFVDKASGKSFDRPAYKSLKQVVRAGDLIVIDTLDRLGRNYREILNEWKEITQDIKADIVVLENIEIFDSRKFRMEKDGVNIGIFIQEQFLSLLAFMAEKERENIRIRQREGIERAKKEGKHLGRPRLNLQTITKDGRLDEFERLYKSWRSGERTAVSCFEEFGISKTKWYEIVKEYEKAQ